MVSVFGKYYYPGKLGFFVWLQAAGAITFYDNVIVRLIKIKRKDAGASKSSVPSPSSMLPSALIPGKISD